MHGWGGGVRRHVEDLARLIAGDVNVLFIEPASDDTVRLRVHECGTRAYFALPGDLPVLAHLLQSVGVARVHIHHVNGLPEAILDLAAAAELPYDITLHDYLTICPQLHLVTAEGRYCGEPAIPGCTVCLAGRPPAWPLDIVGWRARFATVLRNASRVIAPSSDVAARILRYVPGIEILVWPHAEPPLAVPHLLRVATLGMLGPEKGLHVVTACAQDAHARALPLSYRILGGIGAPLPPLPSWRLSLGGEYRELEVVNLIAAEKPDVLWFPAQVPETFAYTISSAIASGLPIVASDFGAFRERLAGRSNVRLVAWDAMPSEWNDALLSFALPATTMPSFAGALSLANYRDRYLAPVVAATARPPLPELPYRHFEAPTDPRRPELSLAELVMAGVACGKREAREELERRTARVDVDFAELRGRVDGLIDALSRAEDETTSARSRIDELETSTTWRMTAPLRDVMHRIKVVVAGARAGIIGMRHLPHRASLAMTLLRDEGPRALGARVIQKLRGGGVFRPSSPTTYRQAESIVPLTFSPATAPSVSIVIPVYGKPLLTFTCLQSVHAHTAAGTFEVIVVDDASSEPMQEALSPVTGVRFERNPENLGFLASCNRGVGLARGEYVVLLNNDTITTAGWLDSLLRVFVMRPDAGLVGPKLVYPDGRLQEAGGIVWRDGSAWNLGRDGDPDKPEYNYLREADYVSGACFVMPVALYRAIGGFDARYAPAYYEDTDLAFAVRAAGRRVYYQPDATIVHFEGQTSGTDVGAGVKRHQSLNRVTFRDKWSADLASHRPNGQNPELERDRNAKWRVLFIDARMLTPDHDSGSQRTLAMLELMIDEGAKVTFVGDNLEHRLPYVRQLQQRGVEVVFAPYVRSVSQLIAERGREFDLIVMARHYVAARHVETVRKFAPRALVAFDTVDLHFLRGERLAELDGGSGARMAARARREEELALIRSVDVTIVVSSVERDVLRTLVPEADVLLLSNIHEPTPGGLSFAEREGLMFIGGFEHPPNTDGVLWYAREVLPLIRQRLPGVVSYIVGSKVPSTIRSLAAADFVVTGYVPDVAPFFSGCRLSIAPLRYGAGVKGKVNLAMSHGLPVVATSAAVEAMHLESGRDVIVADDAAGFAAAVERLYRDEALWNRIAASGIENVRRHFSRDVARAALRDLFARVDAHPRHPAGTR